MAEIAPFRGLRYNLKKTPDLAEVVIPPYDVISKKEQDLFHRRNPHNMIRLELGETTAHDSPQDNPHTRAKHFLEDWMRSEILIRDEQPAIYYYELDYSLTPQTRQTRYGFICLLRLEDFGGGGVRPHERTFQAIKNERLGLTLSCRANLSPVFALYADPSQLVDHHLKMGRDPEPFLAFNDDYGMRHRIWPVTNSQVLRQVRALMLDKAIFIADGHHRYETALNYRNIQRNQFPQAQPTASFEYIMVYLSNMNQGGLTILPTHRLLRTLGAWEPKQFLARAQSFFEVSAYPADEAGLPEWRRRLEMVGLNKGVAIGFYSGKVGSLYLLKAKSEEIGAYLTQCKIPPVLHGLDVVVLDEVIFRTLLGVSESLLADENNIHFRHDLMDAFAGVQSSDYEVGFFINPTRIEQVQDVATAGLIMPHKSTYFYPKVGSGLVINLLDPDEQVRS